MMHVQLQNRLPSQEHRLQLPNFDSVARPAVDRTATGPSTAAPSYQQPCSHVPDLPSTAQPLGRRRRPPRTNNHALTYPTCRRPAVDGGALVPTTMLSRTRPAVDRPSTAGPSYQQPCSHVPDLPSTAHVERTASVEKQSTLHLRDKSKCALCEICADDQGRGQWLGELLTERVATG